VAWDELNVISQWKQFFSDRVNEFVVVTFWKVGAADGPSKDDIANPSQLLSAIKKDHMTRGMAWAMNHRKLKRTDRYGVTIHKPPIGLKRISHRET
jgi:hypothetical protein